MDIYKSVLEGNKRAIARFISLIEQRSEEAIELLKKIHGYTGNAVIIGITGPPGGGKSSIVNQLAKKIRSENKKVGIIAVDPSSPFSGGALLGDRIRMQDLTLDEGVFIRSMGTRGALGGLSLATYDSVKVLDAAGMDYVLIETVGVGQSEVDIVKLADIVLLVQVPGLGDDVQAIKAGIMEIGDIFVVNKADREGAERLVTEIEMTLDLNPAKYNLRPPVVKTVATTGEGINELYVNITEIWEQFAERNIVHKKRLERAKQELIDLVKEKYFENFFNKYSTKIHDLADLIYRKQVDPYSASEIIRQDMRKNFF